MKIHTALILCAGFGKRLNPITINTPKPLLVIKNLTLLDHCINLIVKLNIKKVLINSFFLIEQINEFVRNHNYNIEIKVIEDGENILDTGGCILNLIDKSDDDNFLIFNPDTIWNNNYANEINHIVNFINIIIIPNCIRIKNKKIFFIRFIN